MQLHLYLFQNIMSSSLLVFSMDKMCNSFILYWFTAAMDLENLILLLWGAPFVLVLALIQNMNNERVCIYSALEVTKTHSMLLLKIWFTELYLLYNTLIRLSKVLVEFHVFLLSGAPELEAGVEPLPAAWGSTLCAHCTLTSCTKNKNSEADQSKGSFMFSIVILKWWRWRWYCDYPHSAPYNAAHEINLDVISSYKHFSYIWLNAENKKVSAALGRH